MEQQPMDMMELAGLHKKGERVIFLGTVCLYIRT